MKVLPGYDNAYEAWKQYRKKRITKHRALRIIGDYCDVRMFFLLYPLYKVVRLFRKVKRRLASKRRDAPDRRAPEGLLTFQIPPHKTDPWTPTAVRETISPALLPPALAEEIGQKLCAIKDELAKGVKKTRDSRE